MRACRIVYPIRAAIFGSTILLLAACLVSGCRKQERPADPKISESNTNVSNGTSTPPNLPSTNALGSSTNLPATASTPAVTNSITLEPLEKITAIYNNGVRHLQGDGVPPSTSEAMRYFRQAADLGHPGAQHNLGVLLLTGRGGITQDLVQASALLRKSADQGLAEAQFKMASLYANGVGVTQDLKEAAAWVRKAADQGHIEAAYNLATLYVQGRGIEQNFAEAVRWYIKAAEKGKAAAQSNLGVFYGSGRGVTQDFAEANKWFRRAAEQGHSTAQFNLGRSYAEGKAVEQDYMEAYKWYILSAGQGDPDAGKEQLELGLKMTSIQLSEAIRRANKFTARLETNQPPVPKTPRPPSEKAEK